MSNLYKISQAVPLQRARLLISEFEKLKVQIIYGSLVGGHPPSAWLKASPQGGLLGEDGKFYLDKNAHFSELNSPALWRGRYFDCFNVDVKESFFFPATQTRLQRVGFLIQTSISLIVNL
jgi:hypothetical protein